MSAQASISNFDRSRIAMAMQSYGGFFVKQLGGALLYADAENAAKICATWPELIEQYRAMAMTKIPESDAD